MLFYKINKYVKKYFGSLKQLMLIIYFFLILSDFKYTPY